MDFGAACRSGKMQVGFVANKIRHSSGKADIVQSGVAVLQYRKLD